MKISHLLPALLLVTFTASQASAYDLAGDWSTSSASTPPSANWAYGVFTTPGDASTFDSSEAVNNGNLSGENGWQLTVSSSDPNIEKNLSGSQIIQGEPGANGTVVWNPGTVAFGPANGGAVAQFTTTTAGYYDISATFMTTQIRDVESDGTTGYIYINGISIGDTGVLQDPGQGQFGTPVTLTDGSVYLGLGDTVDFLVGGGNFTTQVDAMISAAVPEPSNWAVGGALFLGLCALRFRSVRI